jgi:hypothetical protein
MIERGEEFYLDSIEIEKEDHHDTSTCTSS